MRKQMRFCCALSLVGLLGGGTAFGQTSWTNLINPFGVTDVWGVAANWASGPSTGVPGFDVNTSTGNSNDDAVVYFGLSNSSPATLDLLASNYVLRSLFVAESTNANINVDGNIISTLGPSSLTLEEVQYFQGGRQLDIYTNVSIIDKVDGKAFVINQTNGNTLDFGGGVRGTEGLTLIGNQTLYIRGYDMGYGVDPTNGLTLVANTGGSKRLAFNGTFYSNLVHDIPYLNMDSPGARSTGGGNLTFLNLSPSNTVTVNISNLSVLAPEQINFRIGGESAADGTPIVTVNVNDEIDFATGTITNIDRSVYNSSVFGGIVNLNSNIMVNQDLESTRTLYFQGNGVFNLNGYVLQTNGTLRTRPVRIDGDRSLVVAVDNPDRLGAGQVGLNNGSVLRMNYDVFTSLTNLTGGYPGSNLVYSEDRNVFLDFGTVQGGFFDPRYDNASSGLVVRAFNGIAGNLTGAYMTNTGGLNFSGSGITFQTNSILAENTINQPAFADFGNTLWMGITNAKGTYTDVGNTTTIFRGVAISAVTPVGEGDILSSDQVSIEQTPIQSGFKGDVTAASGLDLRVLIPGTTIVTPSASNATDRASFNSDTGIVRFEGPGLLQFVADNSFQVLDGSASNAFRLGLDGVRTPDNPTAINTQNSEILRLQGANSIPTNYSMTVADGQVRFYTSGDVLGNNASGSLLTSVLVISNGASIFADNNNSAVGYLDINRGKYIFQGDGAVYAGGGNDGFGTLALGVRTNMVISPQALFIINDAAANSREMNSAGSTFFLTNMNIVINDDTMRTAMVANAVSAWALQDGKRMINAANQNANLNRIFRIASNVTNDVAITAQRNASEVRISATGARTFTIGANVATTNATWTTFNNYTNRFVTVLEDSTTRSNATQNGTVVLNGLTNEFQNMRLEGGAATINGNRLLANIVESRSGPGVGGNLVIGAGLSTITNAVSIDGGDFLLGNTASDQTRIIQDLVIRETSNDQPTVTMGSGVVEISGNVYIESQTSTNLIAGGAITPQFNMYSETGIVSGSVWVGPTNPGVAGTAIIRINDVQGFPNNVTNQVTDRTVIAGDLVLNTIAARTTGAQVNGGDLVVSNNIIVNPLGLDRRIFTTSNDLVRGASANAGFFTLVATRDAVTNDGVGILDRLIDGTLAQGSSGIVNRAYSTTQMEFNRTNFTYDIGQKFTIDNGGPNYREDVGMLSFQAVTNLLVVRPDGTNGVPGTGTLILNVTNVWLGDDAHLRIDEGNTDVRIGLVLVGTNTALSDGTSTAVDEFDLLNVDPSSPGSARTLWIGTTNGVAEEGFNTTLRGISSADVTLNVFNGAMTVSNGAGNVAGLARTFSPSTNINSQITLQSGAALAGISNISGRFEVGDFGRLLIQGPRTNDMLTIGNEIRIANFGPNYYQFTNAPIAVQNVGGIASGNTTYDLTNVVMADGAFLRVQLAGANERARLGLTVEGTASGGRAYLSENISTTADNFDLSGVRSSVGGQARNVQIGTTNSADDAPLISTLFGTATEDIAFDVFRGGLIVTNGGDVQGSVRVYSLNGTSSVFAVSHGGVEEILNLSGNGTVIGNVLVSNVLAPGLSPGTLTVTGNMQFVATSILDFELSATQTNLGGGINDLLLLTSGGGFNGDLTLDGTLLWTNVASVAGNGWTNGDYWTLMTYTGALVDNGLDIGTLPTLDAGLAWLLDTSVGGEVRLSIVIPEPSAWALLALGFTVLGILSRYRRKS